MMAFIPKDSPIHRVDARVKLLYLIFLMFILITRQDLDSLLIFSMVTLLLYWLSQISLTQPLNDLGKGWLFIIMPIFLHVLINPQTGLYSGILDAIFLLNLLLISLLNIYTTEIKSMLQTLVFFKVPSELAFMLTISMRFLPIMQNELSRIRISQTLRGYELHPFSVPIPLVVPLLSSSLNRARELAISLESRGFDSENIHVTVELELAAADYLVLFLLPLLLFLTF